MKFMYAVVLSLSALLLVAVPARAESTLVMTKADLKWKDMGNGIAAAPVAGAWPRDEQKRQGTAPQSSLTTSLPKLRPSSSPINASGACSKPSATSSRNFTLPSRTHGAMALKNSE